MNLTLTWTNLNSGPFTTNIYRGTTQLDRAALANPIATLTNGESSYVDTTAVRGTQYYYVIETVVGADKYSTPNIPIKAIPQKGPGPAALLVGDYMYGYFGTLSSGEFINTNDLRNAVGIGSSVGVIVQAGPTWHKWVRKGKTLYIPNGPICGNMSYKGLYDLGLVFGVDGPGPYNPGANVNQSAKVTFGGNTYRVRLMTGFSDVYTDFPANTTLVAEPTETFPNEWNDLVYPLCQFSPDLQRMANVQQASIADLSLTVTGATTGSLVQERFSALSSSTAIVRGNSAASRTGIANRNSISNTSLTQAWWPVLELVES